MNSIAKCRSCDIKETCLAILLMTDKKRHVIKFYFEEDAEKFENFVTGRK